MGAADTRALFDAINAGGGSVRFVGGCVRDAILGRPVSDIDLATDVEPARVIDLLGAQKICCRFNLAIEACVEGLGRHDTA